MIFLPDFLTAKVAAANADVTYLLRLAGRLNPAMHCSCGGAEYGVPLDLRPLAVPIFAGRNPHLIQDVADFLGTTPGAFTADLARGRFGGDRWPSVVFTRLRTLRPSWFVFWEVSHGLTDTLKVVGANPVRGYGLLTPFKRMADKRHLIGTPKAKEWFPGGVPALVYGPVPN